MTSQRTEEIVTSVLSRITGTLSILGSSAIILSMMMGGRKKLKSSFNRLLFMLCFFDLFPSMAHVWSSSALPEDDYYYSYGAAGNWTTCRIQGFMFQLGFAVPIYFYFLTVHYLLVIRYGMKEERIRRRIEPFMHAFAITFALGTSICSGILEIFNPDFNGCWLIEYPRNCYEDSDVDCIHGENAEIYIWVFAGMPSILPLFLVPFNMGWIFWTVRKQTLKMNRYSANSILHASTSMTRRSFTTLRQSFTMGKSTPPGGEFPSDSLSIASLRRKMKCKTAERLKAVAQQGLAYSLCYLLVFSWPVIMYNLIGYAEGDKPPVSIAVLYSIFHPLQGFLNYIIYVRPFVVQVRKTHPEWSIIRAMYVVTFPRRPGKRNCQKLNCCFSNRNENENIESIIVEFQSKNEADSDLASAIDREQSGKGLDHVEQEEEKNDQSDPVQRGAEDGEKALIQALARAASFRGETEEGLNTEQKIKEESEYFEAITELSKITGNYS